VADLGEGPGGGKAGPLLFWVKKEKTPEGRKAGRAIETNPPPPTPFAQRLDPPLLLFLLFY